MTTTLNGEARSSAERNAASSKPETVASKAQDTPGYYGHPIVKPHVWKGYIGWYFFTGGLAGASSVIAATAELTGHHALAKHAHRASMIGLLPSPVLLIADLGRPTRFLKMLRVIKPTSPMSIGSWLLTLYAGPAVVSAALGELHLLATVRRRSAIAAGLLGSMVTTYTAVLVADTATPVWHEAWRELPPLFASSAAASAGAVTTALSMTSGPPSRGASLIAALGATSEVATSELMRRRLGHLDTYASDPRAKRLDRAATVLSGLGAMGMLARRRSRTVAFASAVAITAGSALMRLAVLRAGAASAEDPRSVLRSSGPTNDAPIPSGAGLDAEVPG
jgi:formate-dependent nitrite reductase membrane component NrfD